LTSETKKTRNSQLKFAGFLCFRAPNNYGAIPGFNLEALQRFFDHWCKVNELKNVINPPPSKVVGTGELYGAMRDYVNRQVSARDLASEISCEEFSAIQALFEFAYKAPVSEAFNRGLLFCQSLIDHHRADPDEYLQALIQMSGNTSAFERIIYSLDMLGQTGALEAILGRYCLEPARERLLERSQRHKRIDA
jgi:hypothetical protein